MCPLPISGFALRAEVLRTDVRKGEWTQESQDSRQLHEMLRQRVASAAWLRSRAGAGCMNHQLAGFSLHEAGAPVSRGGPIG
jgi:hypothetical protein